MTSTQEPPTVSPGDLADRYRDRAQAAIDRYNPYDHEFPLATPQAVLAVSAELAGTTEAAARLAHETERIADALEAQAEQPDPDYTETELQVIRGEISRTDTKASILLASVAIVAGPLAERADTLLRQPWLIGALGLVAAVLAGLSTWLLLDVVLPRLVGISNANFIHYARCRPQDLDDALGHGADRRGELVALSGIAHAKFRRLARAGLLLKLSGLAFAATTGLAVTF
ncbi:hypothetical protein ACGF7W_35205 [Streptomyces sp. NPDC048219]|uniref:hypothetical protein n=1 Tax=Streptomyces sp. NPDC048219 TaxID=3365517 RepID=UPI003719B1EB